MERLTKATVFSLSLICLGIGILTLVLVEWIRPPVPRMDPVANNTIRLEANWFTHRTLRLMTDPAAVADGVDLNLLERRNPFARPEPAPEPVVEAEPEPMPEPEPDPPPETRQIDAVYRGLYRNSNGELLAYIEMEGGTRVFPVGSQIASFWTVVEANVNEVILGRGKDKELRLPFNRKKSLEVPIR